MKYIFTAYIFLGTLFGSAQSATRVNATNAAPVSMSNTAKILWVDNNDPNNTIKASSTSTTVYTKDAADATFMKNSVAADSINAMKTTINNNQAATNSQFGNYYTKTQSDGRYLQSEVDGSVTNEIELPSQSGQSGKILSTNGSVAQWVTPPSAPVSSVNGQTGAVTITESDPTVSATVKAITATNVNNWNAAATASGKTRVYDKTGLISSNGMPMTDTFTISTATPTISFATLMSNIGATAFKIKAVTGYRVGATTSNSPQVSVTTLTSNSASFIINQTNTATLTLLSTNLLSGLPTILAPDPLNVKLVLDIIFY